MLSGAKDKGHWLPPSAILGGVRSIISTQHVRPQRIPLNKVNYAHMRTGPPGSEPHGSFRLPVEKSRLERERFMAFEK